METPTRNATFHLGQHCLLGFKKTHKYTIIQKILILTPKNAIWAIKYLVYQYVWESPSEYKWLIRQRLNMVELILDNMLYTNSTNLSFTIKRIKHSFP